MGWLLEDFALLSVVLNAAILAFQALVVGGLIYVAVIAIPAGPAAIPATDRCRRGIRAAAVALAVTELLHLSVESAVLMATIQLSLRDVLTAGYFVSCASAVLASTALYFLMRGSVAPSRAQFTGISVLFTAVFLASSLFTSHAVSRLDHRVVTAALTGVHQLAVASWIGAMPFLLISLKAVDDTAALRFISRRFSGVAMVSVGALVAGGLGLCYYYIDSPAAVYGTAYGFMVVTKSALLLILLCFGALNWWLVRSLDRRVQEPAPGAVVPASLLFPRPLQMVRRIGEVEIGIGFAVILAAASLTSQPPAMDLTQDRVTAAEIAERFRPRVPILRHPPVSELSPATPIEQHLQQFNVESSAWEHRQRADIEDSEASHHWAGLILLFISAGAWLSRSKRFPWARYWPLGFIALSVFLLIRVDPENWPLGPNSFWSSFSEPEVLEHRIIDVLLVCYAVFEAGVQTNRFKSLAAAAVFPLMVALGGAALLLHSHALGNAKEELLIEMNHNAIAICALVAGWTRWLEIRLPGSQGGRVSRFASLAWPICLVLVAVLLLNYHES